MRGHERWIAAHPKECDRSTGGPGHARTPERPRVIPVAARPLRRSSCAWLPDRMASAGDDFMTSMLSVLVASAT